MYGATVTNDYFLPCSDVRSSSVMEIRVHEKHFLSAKRIGTLKYPVSTVEGQLEASFGEAPLLFGVEHTTVLYLSHQSEVEFDTRRFRAVLSFPAPEVVSQFDSNFAAKFTHLF